MTRHYQTLGLPNHASRHEIRQKFRELAKKLHPDHNPDNPVAAEEFKKITASYAVLMSKSEQPAERVEVARDPGVPTAWLWAFSPLGFWGRLWTQYMKIVIAQ